MDTRSTQEYPPPRPPPPSLAVQVRNASKRYRDGNLVLDRFNMSVQVGSMGEWMRVTGASFYSKILKFVYNRLSKTTILSSIVGLRKLDKGSIKVFGSEPGNAENIPGYMPQEIALYKIFRIQEIFQYYGRITNMKGAAVHARMEFLLEFLELPDARMLVKELSGGQQRRLSLGVAMLHSPQLLILDEPTVGVDPTLRESIWDYLQQLVRNQRTTIIITTHYIEEAKQSDLVGIMRNGRLLVESAPSSLLAQYNTIFLEKVFLQLCSKDEDKDGRISVPSINEAPGLDDEPGKQWITPTAIPTPTDEPPSPSSSSSSSVSGEICDNLSTRTASTLERHSKKIQSVVFKNILNFIRIPLLGVMLLLIPLNQVFMLQTLLGHEPKHVPLGIVNNELPPGESLAAYCSRIKDGCFTQGTSSCRFLNAFSTEDVHWVQFDTEGEALSSVSTGQTLGYLSIPANYTQHSLDRFLLKFHMENETIEGSTIKGRLDVSYSLKSDFVKNKAYLALGDMAHSLSLSCNSDPRLVEVPLKFKAIYGDLNPTFHSFIRPGVILLTLVLLPMASALSSIRERREGTQQRAFVSGLAYPHIIIGFMITEGFLILLQVLLVYGIVWLGGFTSEGPIWQVFGLTYLMGFVGLAIGFFVGECMDAEVEATFMILAFFIPMMSSSGAIWDASTVPYWAQSFYRFASPVSLPIQALRATLAKGWGISHPTVMAGFLSEISWIVGLFGLSAIVRKVRRN